MDPLMRKLFQPREAREKLRGMGGIMSSSPQLASTVAKFQQGGPIQTMAPERSDLGGAMPLASAIHEPSGMMYGEMSSQQLSALANGGDRLAAEVLMMLQPSAGVQPVELETTAVAPAPVGEFQEDFDFGQGLPPSETGGLGTRIAEGLFGGAVDEARDVAARGEELKELRKTPAETAEEEARRKLLREDDKAAPSAETAEEEARRKLLREDDKAAPSADTPAPKLDPNDPDTFDTTYDKMLTRLQSVMGTKDEDSRQKAMANLAMIGLAIASGQSPDALTNIAQGALTGVKAIREDQAADKEQDKALRMAALNAALEMEQGTRSAEATAARDELKFQRDIQLEQEKARLGGGSGRDPRAIEDFVQNVYTEALKAASSVAAPPDMIEGEAPEAYAARKADTARQYMGQQFPGTYGGGGDPIMTRVQEALQKGMDPAKLRTDFTAAYPNLDPSAYGL
jgi:hypothetical protein